MIDQEQKQFGSGPAAEVRRWLKELDLADKQEKEWRQTGEDIYRRYRGQRRKKNSYNILWSNTETLAPALFNTPPSPDVRRRYRDEDPVGKIVSQMLERCLEFQTDTEGFMQTVKQDVLDAILPGRGVSRIKYVPTFVPAAPVAYDQNDAEAEEGTESETPEGDEVLAWEQCETEHVQWDDFRHGPGKTWAEVQWVAFRHRMNKEELMDLVSDQSPEIQEAVRSIPVDNCADDSIDKDSELKSVFGTVEVWEFWCKEYRQVKFITKAYKSSCLKEVEDPLKLNDFFPNPRPLYAINDSACLTPTPLFDQYKEQADELDALSSRINRIVNALKVRGVYDATVAELSELMRADDNKLIPTQNAAMWLEKGGLEKAIYWMPIEQAASVLQVLYNNREQSKQVIYELSGIADVRRGSTDPNETLGAQQLKADFGNQRISGLRLEVERYVRDLMRLMSEVIAEKFQPETLLRMSQMQVPTEAEVQQKVAQTQMQAAQSVPPGQDPQQAIMQAMQSLGQRPVTLEQVMQVMHDDATRMFKIDVETDSMISATAQQDMAGLREVLSGVRDVMAAFTPAVEAGAMPAEAVKQIIMVVCRRAKMGSAVEDELDKITAPQPRPSPQLQVAQAKMQADAAAQQAKAQSAAQVEQIKAASDARIAQIEAAMQQQTDLVRQRAEAAQHQAKLDNEAQLAALKQSFDERDRAREMEFQQWKTELDAAVRVKVASIAAAAKGVIQIDPSIVSSTQEITQDLQQ